MSYIPSYRLHISDFLILKDVFLILITSYEITTKRSLFGDSSVIVPTIPELLVNLTENDLVLAGLFKTVFWNVFK